MDYYKVIIDDNVVDVGTIFLKWNTSMRHMFMCSANEAQFVMGRDSNTCYRDDWMKMYEGNPSTYLPAKVVMINAREYDEIRALLEDGEDIHEPPEPIPEPEPEPHEEPAPEPDAPMTISEMRQQITEMSAMMEMLTECILEISEVIYDG